MPSKALAEPKLNCLTHFFMCNCHSKEDNKEPYIEIFNIHFSGLTKNFIYFGTSPYKKLSKLAYIPIE